MVMWRRGMGKVWVVCGSCVVHEVGESGLKGVERSSRN